MNAVTDFCWIAQIVNFRYMYQLIVILIDIYMMVYLIYHFEKIEIINYFILRIQT